MTSLARIPASRRREAALVTAAVIGVHALLLSGGWTPPGDAGEARVARPAMDVRQIASAVRPVAPAVALPVAAAGDAGPVARLKPAAPRVERRNATSAGAPAAMAAAAAIAVSAAPATPARASADAALPAEPPAAEGSELPTYPTRIAGAFRQGYELRRGAQTGQAELHWQPSAEGYSLELRGGADGVEAIGLVSRGGFDAAGLAPERLVDRRRGRDRSAANFDRVKGRITFSGPRVSYPLPPGAQDRLSWMLQLAGIVEADPARFGPGTRITLFVAGARGDGEPWAFGVLAREQVELADGSSTEALRLRREPVRPYDTRVDVWLDPARGHLPVRTRVDTVPPTQALELLLRP